MGHDRLPDGWLVVPAGNAAFLGAVSHDRGAKGVTLPQDASDVFAIVIDDIRAKNTLPKGVRLKSWQLQKISHLSQR